MIIVKDPWVMYLEIPSDFVISICFWTIPFLLLLIISKRKDIPFGNLFWMFSFFMSLCALTHFVGLFLQFHGFVPVMAAVKMVTAFVSFITAIQLYR